MSLGFRPIADAPISAKPEMWIRLLGRMTVSVSLNLTIYVSTAEFATGADDTPPHQPYRGTLHQPLEFSRTIQGGGPSGTFGGFAAGEGTVVIDNTDGTYDYLVQQYGVDGRAITIRVGRLEDPHAEHMIVFRGTMKDWHVDENKITLYVRDDSYKLDVPVQPNLYGGTGGKDGGDDIKGKRIPRIFGWVYQQSPTLVDAALLIYQINDGPVEDILGVFDQALGLTFGADFATYALLAASTPALSHYNTCLAEGFFKLGSTPNGVVTDDAKGDASGSGFVETTADIIARLLEGTDVPASDIDTGAFDALNLLQPALIGYVVQPEDSDKMADVVSRLMQSIGGWAGFNRAGAFQVQRFDSPDPIPSLRVNRVDILDISRIRLPDGLTPPPWRWRVAYGRSWTTQTQLDTGITDVMRAFVAEDYRLAEASDNTILEDHPLAQDPPPIEAYFRDEADADDEAERLLALYRTVRALYRMSIPRIGLLTEIGHTLSVMHPRFDLSAGRRMRMVAQDLSIVFDADSKQTIDGVQVTAYG